MSHLGCTGGSWWANASKSELRDCGERRVGREVQHTGQRQTLCFYYLQVERTRDLSLHINAPATSSHEQYACKTLQESYIGRPLTATETRQTTHIAPSDRVEPCWPETCIEIWQAAVFLCFDGVAIGAIFLVVCAQLRAPLSGSLSTTSLLTYDLLERPLTYSTPAQLSTVYISIEARPLDRRGSNHCLFRRCIRIDRALRPTPELQMHGTFSVESHILPVSGRSPSIFGGLVVMISACHQSRLQAAGESVVFFILSLDLY